MCKNPNKLNDGQEVACRTCNDCIAVRKADWVARSMAEMATSGNALVFTLTFQNDVDGNAPREAKVFDYKVVQDFLKRIRNAYKEHYEKTGEISYIVAGEKGSQKGRVHWHMVIFSKEPLGVLGEWSRPWYYNPNAKSKDSWYWSIWNAEGQTQNGHVDLKQPDEGGMRYVLKYALKDQFNVVKSKGTMRYSKSENHGASFFRMSKKPPIGFRWLDEKLDRLQEMGAVLPKLEMKIPNYSGYWWPRGTLRDHLLNRLHLINEDVRQKTGRDAPQWTTLLTSVESLEKDWETLVYGQIEQTEPHEFEGRSSESIRQQCGHIKLCERCYKSKDREAKKAYRSFYKTATKPKRRLTDVPENWTRFGHEPNPFCEYQDDPIVKKAFFARGKPEFVER